MSHPTGNTDTQTEQALMDAAKIESLSTAEVRNVDSESYKPRLTTQMKPQVSSDKRHDEPITRKSIPDKETVSADMFLPYMRSTLRDVTTPEDSWFYPSAFAMYYIIHAMDINMGQAFYFTRSTNLWHPYISRIYFGILYIVQVMRCEREIGKGSTLNRIFLSEFLQSFPPESLSVPGPLVNFFKAISVSQPENKYLGKVYPTLPSRLGPDTAKSIVIDNVTSWHLPNIPLLIGFAKRLCSNEARTAIGSPSWPTPWNPLVSLSNTGTTPNQPTVNGSAWSSDATQWSPLRAWSLVTPGIEYEPESPRTVDETFAKYGYQIGLPTISPDDNLKDPMNFMQLDDLRWFSRILPVMTQYAKHFKASTTLDKCSPVGPAAGQIIIQYNEPKKLPVQPKLPGDPASMFPLVFTARSTSNILSQTDELYAFLSQINVRMFTKHPFLSAFGAKVSDEKAGPFWDISPISKTSDKESGVYQVEDVIRDHFFLDRPKN